jgi:large subunit ribosomal protein L31
MAKASIHPNYQLATITCACGAVYETASTRGSFAVEICARCHPFYTGRQKLIDSAGRIERFQKRYQLHPGASAASAAAAAKPKAEAKPKADKPAEDKADKPAKPKGEGDKSAKPKGEGDKSAKPKGEGDKPAKPKAEAKPAS